MYNGCDTLDSSQLSFRAKHSVDPESRGNASKLVLNPNPVEGRLCSGIWIPDQVRDDKRNTFSASLRIRKYCG